MTVEAGLWRAPLEMLPRAVRDWHAPMIKRRHMLAWSAREAAPKLACPVWTVVCFDQSVRANSLHLMDRAGWRAGSMNTLCCTSRNVHWPANIRASNDGLASGVSFVQLPGS